MKYTLFCLTLLVFTFSACKKEDDKETILDVNETNSLKNPPRGYEKEHPAIEFLKLKTTI